MLREAFNTLKVWLHGDSFDMFTVFQLVLSNASSNKVETITIT